MSDFIRFGVFLYFSKIGAFSKFYSVICGKPDMPIFIIDQNVFHCCFCGYGFSRKNNFINPSAFKKLSSLNSAYKTYAESSDGDISNNFTADNSPAYTGKQLSFNPTRNVSLFESQFEKDVRTGNLFELRRAQVQNNVFNIIGTAQTPSYLR
jgi:ribosomal protein L31